MDESKLAIVGAMSKLPPGFRFQPTDEEIVFQYLAPKIFSCPLPASIIPEISISKYDPCREFPGDSTGKDKYFFSNKEPGNRSSRATEDGYWKGSGSDKRIIYRKRKPIMGMKKTLVFHKGKYPQASRTDWIMHEYSITIYGNIASNSKQRKNSQGSFIQIGNWVLCHVFKKKPSTKTEVYVDRPRFCGLMKSELEDTCSSSCASSSSSNLCSDHSSFSSEVSSNAANEETSSRNV
ncbi:NAC domain-containing 83-like [Olea europaea subsp. europaea]|uniref:NAC domain-containing 83-like n=1 Tax=Olea europaea subsp. europaea TaxID=158383 RepID=A0A8S0TU88_OLEEU|nr:NAC domain-containing 83-like [Olea europaea subsp. europaea]